MKKVLLFLISVIGVVATATAQNVTIKAVNQSAAMVFRSIVEQTGKNFVYSSELLDGVRVSVSATNKPLKDVLTEMFANTNIKYKIKGNNIMLMKRKQQKQVSTKVEMPTITLPGIKVTDSAIEPKMLDEVVVVSRLEAPMVESVEIGAKKITAEEVRNTPALFGEADVIKAIQMQPGVAEGTEGLAGMYVHGGNADENLYMLDNVPIYQVNHFAGLFSAFNTDIIRYIDFFKSSMPAKYDGRLASFMDVRLQNGNHEGHHGSARLGLTSGAFNISGPIGNKTTYLIGVRRSWLDVLTIPFVAIANSQSEDDKVRFNYYFMDLNARIQHNISPKATAFASFYFGDDNLKSGSEDKGIKNVNYSGQFEKDYFDMHWGNMIAQAGLNYRFNENISSEFTAAYTRFFSNMKHDYTTIDRSSERIDESQAILNTTNNINDWIFRGDFDWRPNDNNRVRLGGGYTRHSFLPAQTSREYTMNTTHLETRDSTWTYGANEVNAYIEDDWKISRVFRMNVGVHTSLFNINGKTKSGLSPRLSFSFRQNENLAMKLAYARTTQYVHQLNQSYLSLPTDQWIPVTDKFKPETADKISLGGYWQVGNGKYSLSIEGYYKWMNNLIDYRDEYYLRPPLDMWNAQLCDGKGTAKGIDFKIEKDFGNVTGHVSYSLAWADRTFLEKNAGKTYPAKFDNRHTINVVVNWKINGKIQLNASWTGHSGNRFTLLNQVWNDPDFGDDTWANVGESPLRTEVNKYRLPFYHRLDLSCTVNNRRGYWTFGLYNAYCHMNTVAIMRGTKDVVVSSANSYYIKSEPAFKRVKLLPIIPSISYTWLF
jgi:hypothetical protein